MKSVSINASSRKLLGSLLDSSRLDLGPWSLADLRAILEHQLDTPLLAERERFEETSSDAALPVAELDASGAATFGELLMSDSTSGSTLRLVKDFAKASLAAEGDLPREVARVLYTLAILVALKVGEASVTSLDDEAARREGYRCLTFAWLPASVASRLRQLLAT